MKQERILGYRLALDSQRYQPILPQAGLYRSNVLGLDLAIVNRSLKFYQGAAELYDTAHLIRRLEDMVTNLEKKNDEIAQEAEKNRATIRDMILDVLATRGVTCTKEAIEQLHSCIDADVLRQWVTRAFRATSEADVFSKKA